MFARTRDPLDPIRSLAHHGANAEAVLQIVATRFDGEVPPSVRQTESVLASLSAELSAVLTDQAGEADAIGGWALDRSWRAAVFGVASSRPRVLLTVAANAIRSLDDMYGHVLEESWDDHLTDVLHAHRAHLGRTQAALLGERAGLTTSPLPAAEPARRRLRSRPEREPL
jgi:hypothetical protein